MTDDSVPLDDPALNAEGAWRWCSAPRRRPRARHHRPLRLPVRIPWPAGWTRSTWPPPAP
ncbi:MAG: hypothetical protein ACLSVD_03080 [Eggerthellaceae bacterium]